MNLMLQLRNFVTGNLLPKSYILYKYFIKNSKCMNFSVIPKRLLSKATKTNVMKLSALEQGNFAELVFNYSDENYNLEDVFTDDDPLCKLLSTQCNLSDPNHTTFM